MCRLALNHEPQRHWQPNLPREMALVPENVQDAIAGLAAGQEPWPLYLFGPAGTGKSRAALCLHDHAGGIYYASDVFQADAVQVMKEHVHWDWHDRKYVGQGAFWDALARTPLLTLDDLGTREVTGPAYERMKRLLDSRESKPTVVVSNLDLKSLAKVYDDRIASRLAAGTVIKVAGKDRRMG